MAIEKVKRHKSPNIDQIPAELIKASGMAIHCEIHKLNNSIWKEEILAIILGRIFCLPGCYPKI